MLADQVARTMHLALQSEDRVLVALCSIFLGLSKVPDYTGDVRLQLEADIRCYGSAVESILHRTGTRKARAGYN